MNARRVKVSGGGVVLPNGVKQQLFRIEQFGLLLEVAAKDLKGTGAFRTSKFRDMRVLERVGFVENLGWNEGQLEVRLNEEGRKFVNGAVGALVSLDELALAEGGCDADGNAVLREGIGKGVERGE